MNTRKTIIRLTESDLRDIITKTVRNIIREDTNPNSDHYSDDDLFDALMLEPTREREREGQYHSITDDLTSEEMEDYYQNQYLVDDAELRDDYMDDEPEW